jgi:malonate-semialdehyde dehydrogenase (acetylating) / methylmalonate-semialdehyde dehydrogenase
MLLRADRVCHHPNMLYHSRIPTRAICVRSYATVSVQPPLRGLNLAVREKAEKLSRDWKGTSSSGENTKNFIGGEFVQSRATQWLDVVDPVRRIYHSPLILT